MDKQKIKNVIEATLLVAGRPVDLNEIMRLFDEEDRPERKMVRDLLDEMTAEYEDRAIEIIRVASGFRVQVREEYGEWVGRMSDRRPPRYSRALMETLALIAYRQPVTRGEIENVRGVTVSSNIVRTLLERGWIRIVGHRDVPGRPAMLGTTKEFLDYFNLTSLDELPSLAELKDIDSINVELDFDVPADAKAADNVADSSEDSGEDIGEEIGVDMGEPVAESADADAGEPVSEVAAADETPETVAETDDAQEDIPQSAPATG